MRLVSAGVIVGVLALSGCGASPSVQSDKTEAVDAMAVQSAPSSEAGASPQVVATTEVAQAKAGDVATSEPAEAAVGGVLLAYAYSARFALPKDNVAALKRKHEAECAAAGVKLCQIVTAGMQSDDDGATGNLSIRATPQWLNAFRARLESDAKGQNGSLVEQNVTSEDLTRAITDSQARLRALKALRTRLEALIADRPAKLADLLEAERELARVQGELDSYESNLAVMRARVDMSAMDLTYQSRSIAVSGGTLAPLTEALTGFVGVMAQSLGAVITFVAMILPFALVLGPLGWLGLRLRNKYRVGAKKAV